MPSRTAGGSTTNKFDNITHPEMLDRMDGMKKQLGMLTQDLEDPIKVDIKHLKEANNARLTDQQELRALVNDHITETQQLLQLFSYFLHTRFFRFLNFFGKWFIYGPDDRVYINTPENRELIKHLLSDPKTEGLSHKTTKKSNEKLKVYEYTNGIRPNETLLVYEYDGTFDEAIQAIKELGSELKSGDMIHTKPDDREYVYDPLNQRHKEWGQMLSTLFPK